MAEEHLQRIRRRSSFRHTRLHRHVDHERPVDASADERGEAAKPSKFAAFQARNQRKEGEKAENELADSADFRIAGFWTIRNRLELV